ncbi:MAG: TonB family protein [Candidatus Sumerlaeia bacterium]|nr:TonB family protein [Candidatus Sumerlaeia bacterium]
MIRMTIISLIGHVLAALSLIMVSWLQPTPKVRKPPAQMVRVIPGGTGQYGGAGAPTPPLKVKTPIPMAAKTTPPPVILTPQPTVAPKKTIAIPKKKTPTPTPKKTPEKKKKATPTPQKTATPAPTPVKTPEKTVTPAKTPAATPGPPAKTAAPKASPSPAAATPNGNAPIATMNIGAGTKAGQPGGVPGIPGGTGPPAILSDYEYYTLSAQMQVDRNFTVPRHLRSPGVSCLIRFTILRDGKIVNIRVLESTGDSVLDGIARRALETTGQLAPFPDTLKEEQVELDFRFLFDPQE